MFRALIVDDHAGFRASVSAALRRRFPEIRVDEAEDGPEALRVIESCAMDMLLLDVKLPTGNGIELTKEIKRSHPSVTVVILTGHDFPQYRQAAYRNGADCFICKGSVACVNEVVARVDGAIQARQGRL